MALKISYYLIRGIKYMDKLVVNIKAWFWVIGCVFTVAVFFQQLLTLNPRVTNLEGRMADVEGKMSAIEIKLDTVLTKTSETCKDVKDIYHLILERHK